MFRRIISVLSGLLLGAGAHAVCTPPTILTPAQTGISVATPRFEWAAVPGVRHYRVWLESRVPEGRVLLAEEFQTQATFFVPPRPLTAVKATVRLRVTAVCEDGTQAVASIRLRIDPDPACRLRAEPLVRHQHGAWRVDWEMLAQAQRYEVRLHAASNGEPQKTLETFRPPASLGELHPGSWLIAVQPVCSRLMGMTHWLAVEVPQAADP